VLGRDAAPGNQVEQDAGRHFSVSTLTVHTIAGSRPPNYDGAGNAGPGLTFGAMDRKTR
jgi:hypothetical protein